MSPRFEAFTVNNMKFFFWQIAGSRWGGGCGSPLTVTLDPAEGDSDSYWNHGNPFHPDRSTTRVDVFARYCSPSWLKVELRKRKKHSPPPKEWFHMRFNNEVWRWKGCSRNPSPSSCDSITVRLNRVQKKPVSPPLGYLIPIEKNRYSLRLWL